MLSAEQQQRMEEKNRLLGQVSDLEQERKHMQAIAQVSLFSSANQWCGAGTSAMMCAHQAWDFMQF